MTNSLTHTADIIMLNILEFVQSPRSRVIVDQIQLSQVCRVWSQSWCQSSTPFFCHHTARYSTTTGGLHVTMLHFKRYKIYNTPRVQTIQPIERKWPAWSFQASQNQSNWNLMQLRNCPHRNAVTYISIRSPRTGIGKGVKQQRRCHHVTSPFQKSNSLYTPTTITHATHVNVNAHTSLNQCCLKMYEPHVRKLDNRHHSAL